MKSYAQKVIGVFLFLFVTAVFFQNCAPTMVMSSMDPEEGTPFINDNITSGVKCSVTTKAPTCKSGSLIFLLDENGCSQATCEVDEGQTCPQYNKPLCGKGQILDSKTDKNGCSVPICVDAPSVANCPIYQKPQCKSGEKLSTQKDANGCSKPVCSKECCSKSLKAIACDKDARVETVSDGDGCSVKTCVKNPNKVCPTYNRPICKNGEELIVIQDKNGCFAPSCKAK